jgi:hypothetical protein
MLNATVLSPIIYGGSYLQDWSIITYLLISLQLDARPLFSARSHFDPSTPSCIPSFFLINLHERWMDSPPVCT